MALIVLNPNETFEHSHGEDSGSILVSGTATLTAAGETTTMRLGVPVTTPAGVSHVLANTGPAAAVVECTHRESEEPPRHR